MTLVSRDLMPARTPYEAELRERLERAEWQAVVYHRLAAAQDAVVRAAQAVVSYAREEQISKSDVKPLEDALGVLDREAGTIVLESMPPQIRQALTAPAIEEGLKAQDGPLFPDMSANRAVVRRPDGVPTAFDVDGLARDLEEAGPLEVEQLAGQGWPASWADYTGIADQEIVWPVQPKGQPVPGGTPVAAFASHLEQALYCRLRNGAPTLLAIARAAAALCGTSVPHYRWCRKPVYDNNCTCEATATNEKLDALRRALGVAG